MSDGLKDFIRNNQEGFREIPPAGLWTEIEMTLKQKNNLINPKKLKAMIKYGFGASALIVGTFVLINLQKEETGIPRLENQLVIDSPVTVPAAAAAIETQAITRAKPKKDLTTPVRGKATFATQDTIHVKKNKVMYDEKGTAYEIVVAEPNEEMDLTTWRIAGSKPKSYQIYEDKNDRNAEVVTGTIKSIDKKIDGFATLMNVSLPDKYLGKRIRLTGYVRTQDVTDWAGLWLRIGMKGGDEALGFDNMRYGKNDRSIKGTTPRTKYEIVLDVPANTSNILYGVMLVGTGQIWFNSFELEVVDNSTPTTGVDPHQFDLFKKDKLKSYHPSDFWRWYVPGVKYSKEGASPVMNE